MVKTLVMEAIAAEVEATSKASFHAHLQWASERYLQLVPAADDGAFVERCPDALNEFRQAIGHFISATK